MRQSYLLVFSAILILTLSSISFAQENAIKYSVNSEDEIAKAIKGYDWKTTPADMIDNWEKGVPVVWMGKVLEMKAREVGGEVEIVWLCQYVRYIEPEMKSAFADKPVIDATVTSQKPLSLFSISLIGGLPLAVAEQIVARKEQFYIEVVGVTDGRDSHQGVGIVVLQTYKMREIPEEQVETIPHKMEESGQFPAGIVYGSKAAYRIDAPEGWILDNESGLSQGLPCVLYLEGYTWANSPVVMYAKIASPNYPKLNDFLKFTIDYFKKESSSFKHKTVREGKIRNEYKFVTNEYSGGPHGSYEQVTYVQVENAVCYVVLTTNNKEEYEKHFSALEKVMDTFEYMPDFINFENKR